MHLEEVKLEAKGLRNQLLYDPNSLVSLKAKFIWKKSNWKPRV